MAKIANDLKVQSLFKGFESAEIDRIAALVEVRQIVKDEYVFRESTPCKGIYMIQSGKIEVSKTTADGWKQPLVILSKGHFLGEIALLERSNHATDARAVEPTELYFLAKDIFESLEKSDACIMLKLLKNIAIIAGQNVRRMNEKFLKALVNY